MEKLTLEQLRTPGTKIPELSETTKYTTSYANDNQYWSSIPIIRNLVVYGTIFRNSEEHIIAEVPAYKGKNLFQNLIPVSEFIRLGIIDEFALPEKWYIQYNNENRDLLEKWRLSKCSDDYKRNVTSNFYLVSKHHKDNSYYLANTDDTITHYAYSDYKQITFEQFKKYVLKDMDKKIIGYKLIKRIPGLSVNDQCKKTKNISHPWKFSSDGYPFEFSDKEIQDTEFFEPVYEQDKLTKVGKHEVQYLTEGVKIGCTIYHKESLKTALGVLCYTNIQDIRCTDGTIITKDIIEQLLKGLE